MKAFIKACDSIYGGSSCIYRFVNPYQIVELHITHTQREVQVEMLLTSGQRVILLYDEDLVDLVGEEQANEIIKAIIEIKKEKRE